eukprot:PhM_4_TR1096/c0_g2_i1/m.38281
MDEEKSFSQDYEAACAELGCRVDTVVKKQLIGYRQPDILDLTKTYLGPKNFMAVVRALPGLTAVDTVRCRSNGVDNDSMIEFCKVLSTHPAITSIDFSGNPLSYPAAKALIEAIEVNSKVVDITLEETDMYDALIKRIELGTKENVKIQAENAAKPRIDESVGSAPSNSTEPTHSSRPPSSVPKLPRLDSRPYSGRSGGTATSRTSRFTSPSKPNLGGARLTKPTPKPAPPIHATIACARLSPEKRIIQQLNYGVRNTRYAQAVRNHIAKLQRNSVVESLTGDLSDVSVATREDITVERDPREGEVERTEMLEKITEMNEEEARTREAELVKDTSVSILADSIIGFNVGNRRKSSTVEQQLWGREASVLDASFHGSERVRDVPCLEVLETDDGETREFKLHFNQGGVHFANFHLDQAYSEWSRAIDIANDHRRRDWVLLVTSKLQVLHFDCLMVQGDQALKEGYAQTALLNFRRAEELGTRLKEEAWVRKATGKILDANTSAFYRCKDVALNLYSELEQYERETVVDGDVFENPDGTMEMHTEPFVNDWGQMVIFRDALECWQTALHHLPSEAGDVLLQLDELYRLRVKALFCGEDLKSSVSLFRTSSMSSGERSELIRLHTDVLRIVSDLDHVRWKAVTFLYLAHLHMGMNNHELCTTRLREAQDVAVVIGDLTLNIVGLLSSVMCMVMFGEAAGQEDVWKAISNDTSDGIGMCKRFLESIKAEHPPRFEGTVEFVRYLQQLLFMYKIYGLVQTSRHDDALECAEESKTEEFNDLLRRKCEMNFSHGFTVRNMRQVAEDEKCIILQYILLHLPSWNDETFTAREYVYIWALGVKTNVKFVEIQTTALDDTVERFHQSCHNKAEALETRACLEQLYRWLFLPVVDFVEMRCPERGPFGPRIMVVPHSKILWSVPFTALMSDEGRYIVDKYVTTLATSVAQHALAGINLRKRDERDAFRRLVLSGPHAASPTVASTSLCSLLKAENVSGAGATYSALQYILQSVFLLHITPPAIRDGELCLQIATEVGSRLRRDTLEKLDVPAQLVTIDSASETSSPWRSMEHARAWFCAGCASVIMPLWTTAETADEPPDDSILAEVFRTLETTNEISTALTAATRSYMKRVPSVAAWGSYVFLGVDCDTGGEFGELDAFLVP